MLGKLRPITSSFVRIMAYPFAVLKINPNLFSSLAVPLSIAAAYYLSARGFYPAFILALLAVSIDMFDGAVARLQGRTTLFGNYFETMVDKAVEIILFIGASLIHPLAAAFALGFSMLASYAKPRVALVIVTDNRDWPAIGEHSERMLLLLAGIFLSVFSITVGNATILEISLWAIALVAMLGTIQRVFYAKKLIEEAEEKGNVLPYLKK